MRAGDMLTYYCRRAQEYESIYDKLERQGDLSHLRELLPRLLQDRDVLEVACGTGYWTHIVAPAVRSLLATDQSMEVLEIAQTKSYPDRRVHFIQADAYDLGNVPGAFSGGLAAFWWSHIPKQELPQFLSGFHRKLTPGALVVFLDNRYVEGSSTPIARADSEGNTYQIRKLRDGSQHEVLKNFPNASELVDVVTPWGEAVEVLELPYYWLLQYRSA